MTSCRQLLAVTLFPVALLGCSADGDQVKLAVEETSAVARPKAAQAKAVTMPRVATSAGSATGETALEPAAKHGARDDKKVVSAPYRPKVGSRWRLDQEVRKTKSKDGKVVEQTTVKEQTHVVVEATVAEGYRIKSKVVDASMQSNTPMAAIMGPVVESAKGMTLSYDTDGDGVPVRINNVDEIKALMRRAFDAIEQSKPEFKQVPQLAEMMRGIRSQYEGVDATTGATILLEEVQAVALVQGFNLALGEERTYQTEVASLVGSGTMRANGRFRLTKVDNAKGLAFIEHRQTIDPEDLRRVVTGFIAKILPGEDAGSAKFNEAMAKLKIDRNEVAHYEVALADGVVRKMERTVLVTSGPGEQREVTVLTAKPVEMQ